MLYSVWILHDYFIFTYIIILLFNFWMLNTSDLYPVMIKIIIFFSFDFRVSRVGQVFTELSSIRWSSEKFPSVFLSSFSMTGCRNTDMHVNIHYTHNTNTQTHTRVTGHTDLLVVSALVYLDAVVSLLILINLGHTHTHRHRQRHTERNTDHLHM